MNKLKKMPEDAEVLIPNSEMNVDGIYYATNIEEYEDGTVLIDTDYEKRVKEWDEQENDKKRSSKRDRKGF